MGPSGHFYSFLSICGPGVVGVKCWDRLTCYWDMLYFGRVVDLRFSSRVRPHSMGETRFFIVCWKTI